MGILAHLRFGTFPPDSSLRLPSIPLTVFLPYNTKNETLPDGAPMSSRTTLLTADDLMRMSAIASDSRHLELVKGELIERAPAGGRHGRVSSHIDYRLRMFVEQNDLGEVFAAETGFILERNPDTVLAPDAAFVAKGRLPAGDPPVGFPELVPDLVVEVVSPGNTAAEMQAKVEQWLQAGARMVWVFYPDTRSAAVYRGLHDAQILTERDELPGDPVLPGFSCPVRDLF